MSSVGIYSLTVCVSAVYCQMYDVMCASGLMQNSVGLLAAWIQSTLLLIL